MNNTAKNNYLKFYNFNQNLLCEIFNNSLMKAQQQFKKILEKSRAFTNVELIFEALQQLKN